MDGLHVMKFNVRQYIEGTGKIPDPGITINLELGDLLGNTELQAALEDCLYLGDTDRLLGPGGQIILTRLPD